ncbi:hypothetical protein NDU88_003381 [Pleurodeles waltl]|uniref:Uncharacterized protein n=1 Tax=Pleurodeles waltl TaxID=8319 RepID=A0AAV7TQH1_PLEWA|nr:hypothetical protein NDU88_003381 [Pleurodeles waltl]
MISTIAGAASAQAEVAHGPIKRSLPRRQEQRADCGQEAAHRLLPVGRLRFANRLLQGYRHEDCSPPAIYLKSQMRLTCPGPAAEESSADVSTQRDALTLTD